MIKEIIEAVSIPVMAKCRIGHTVEAQILQAVGVDYIDESEVLTMADDQHHIGKHNFKVPFVCGCKNLGEALRRISEGAAMIRTKGEAGTGDVVEAVKHQRAVMADIRRAAAMSDDELYAFAKELSAPYHLLKETARLKRLPVVSFAAGGVATPADAALMMQLGCDGVFVGSGICEWGKKHLTQSSRVTPPSARVRSSRRSRTTTTPRCSPRCLRTLARPWSASRSRTRWPPAARPPMPRVATRWLVALTDFNMYGHCDSYERASERSELVRVVSRSLTINTTEASTTLLTPPLVVLEHVLRLAAEVLRPARAALRRVAAADGRRAGRHRARWASGRDDIVVPRLDRGDPRAQVVLVGVRLVLGVVGVVVRGGPVVVAVVVVAVAVVVFMPRVVLAVVAGMVSVVRMPLVVLVSTPVSLPLPRHTHPWIPTLWAIFCTQLSRLALAGTGWSSTAAMVRSAAVSVAMLESGVGISSTRSAVYRGQRTKDS